jgi:hypothetical protein
VLQATGLHISTILQWNKVLDTKAAKVVRGVKGVAETLGLPLGLHKIGCGSPELGKKRAHRVESPGINTCLWPSQTATHMITGPKQVRIQ